MAGTKGRGARHKRQDRRPGLRPGECGQ